MYSFNAINSPLSTSLSVILKLGCCVFIFTQCSAFLHPLRLPFWPMDYWWCMLLTFQVLRDFPIIFLLLISNLIPWWLKNTFHMTLILLCLLRCVFWSCRESVLVHVPCHMKGIYVLLLSEEVSIRVCWLQMLWNFLHPYRFRI